MQRTRALWLGGVAAAGAVLFAVQAYMATPAVEGTSQPTPGPSRAAKAGAEVTSVEEVRVSRLTQKAPDLPEQTRDPFRYRHAPPPPKVAPARVPVLLGPSVPVPPPSPAPVQPPPPIPLKFVGLVEAGGKTGRVAVLSDSKGGVFYGREGDIIDGRYRLVRVSVEQAELMYPDGRGRQVLRLSGQ
ncbi:MAG: hypothetical protein ABL971_14915 [Vicinamibacterales bacterium]